MKKLFTDKEEGEKVDVIETKDDDDQANFILKTVKELLKKYSMKDIAILCRGRASAGLIVDAFRKHGIPFHFVGEAGFFEEPIVKDVMSYLKVVDDPVESNAEMVRILHRDIYSIRRTDIAKFNTYASDNDLSAFEALEHINKMDIDRKRFEAARSVLEDLIKSKSKMKLLELVHKLLFETDFYRYEIAFDNKKNIALLNKFYKFVEEYDGIYRGFST
ncbi:MAG: hypothetical protein NT016_00520 [Candidatus Aenigmarchaeota archaeon]|nr:hypothetical protein [Candidatus Aenigmarchaeota archaeon]